MRSAISERGGNASRAGREAGMEKPKRARRRKLDTAKADLEPPLAVPGGQGVHCEVESEGHEEKYLRDILSPSHTMRYFLGIGTTLLAGAFFLLRAQPPVSPVLTAMNAELARTRAKLKSQPVPPYYLSYEITETHTIA